MLENESRNFFSISLRLSGEKEWDKEGARSPLNTKLFGLYQSFASPLLTPLNYSLRGKDKQSSPATVVLLISLGNITDNKKRAGGEELGWCCLCFSFFKSLNKSITCVVFLLRKQPVSCFPAQQVMNLYDSFYLMLFSLWEPFVYDSPPMWEWFVFYLLEGLKLPQLQDNLQCRARLGAGQVNNAGWGPKTGSSRLTKDRQTPPYSFFCFLPSFIHIYSYIKKLLWKHSQAHGYWSFQTWFTRLTMRLLCNV